MRQSRLATRDHVHGEIEMRFSVTRIALAFHFTRGPRPEVPVTCQHDLRGWYAMLRLNCILHG